MSNFFSKCIITLNMSCGRVCVVLLLPPSFSPLLLAHVWRSTPDPMAHLGRGDINCCRCLWAEPLQCAGARMTELQTAFYFWSLPYTSVLFVYKLFLSLNYYLLFLFPPHFYRVAPLIPWPYGYITDKHLEINVSVRYRNLFLFMQFLIVPQGDFFLYLLQSGNGQYSFC